MKPLAPMSLSRSAPVPQRDTPDPTSAPINKVLNAFQGNTNSSGTSTKAALDAIKDKSGPVITSAAQDALEVFKEASGSIVVPPASATEKSENSSNEVTTLFGGAAATAAAGSGAPSPTAVPTMIGVAPTPPHGREASTPTPTPLPARARASSEGPSEAPPLPAPPEPGKTDATPSVVATEASNSTSPGSNSFAEAPSNAGRPDNTADAVRAALVESRGFDLVAFLRTTRGMAIVGGAAVLLIIVLVFAFKGGTPASKKAPVAAKRPDKTEVATADKPTTDTDESAQAGVSGTEHAATNNGGSTNESATPPVTPTTDTPVPTTDTPVTSDQTAEHHDPKPVPKPIVKKSGPTIAGKQVVLEYDNQARDAKAAPKNNAAQADQGAISKARQSYAAGNQRLFAGDADGAIRNYKQALAYYPAYVAGYRGLGLAYAQQGNKPAALKALHTYLSSVPSAKDGELIRKRIATLQAK